MKVRATLAVVLGVVMFGIGAFIAVRPLWGAPPVTGGSRVFDYVFAAFFMLRGAMNLRSRRVTATSD